MREKFLLIIFVLLLFPAAFSRPIRAENNPPVNSDIASAAVSCADRASQPMTDIHDLKPVEAVGIDLSPLIYIITGLVIAVLITGVIYYLIRRGKNKITTIDPVLSPEETATRLLEGLSVFKTMPGREFYFRLSAILRGYIKDRFNINAPEMTTEEVLPRIEQIDIDQKLRKDVKKLLSTADPIKFAGLNATIDQMERDLLFVKNFVKQTTSETALAVADR